VERLGSQAFAPPLPSKSPRGRQQEPGRGPPLPDMMNDNIQQLALVDSPAPEAPPPVTLVTQTFQALERIALHPLSPAPESRLCVLKLLSDQLCLLSKLLLLVDSTLCFPKLSIQPETLLDQRPHPHLCFQLEKNTISASTAQPNYKLICTPTDRPAATCIYSSTVLNTSQPATVYRYISILLQGRLLSIHMRVDTTNTTRQQKFGRGTANTIPHRVHNTIR
jgi:hypothetical protein